MARVVIVGAGISGLALAYRLQQKAPHASIAVLEQDARAGGKIWTERHDGFQVECGPNGFLDNKPTTLALCRDVGLGERLIPASEGSSKNRYLFHNNRLRMLPSGLFSFLFNDLLSWRGKLDVLLERFSRHRRPPEDESIDAFARRRAGHEVADVLADALVTGIHAGDPKLLSLAATFPRVAALERQYGSVSAGLRQSARARRLEAKARGEAAPERPRMWSFREGLRLLVETLTSQLAQPPILSATVRRLTKKADGGKTKWIVHGEGNDIWQADAVVLTCPAYQQAALVANVDAALCEPISAIPYNRIVVAALGYRRADVPMQLNGFGYIAPQNTRRDLLGVQWCSSIYPERAPGGAVLLRALAGGWHRPDVASWDERRLLDALRAELRLAMHINAEPIFHRIIRWDRAIPQYTLGHLERVAAIHTGLQQHPGLFLGGNAYHGVAMNDCTEQAEVLAERIASYLKE
jgi:protoporphyrinogen/coproporphyrinogen III oxidase